MPIPAMNIEATHYDSSHGKRSQTSYPPTTMSNYIATEARILKVLPESCSSTKKTCYLLQWRAGLSEPSPPFLAGKVDGRKADGNGSMRTQYGEPGRIFSRLQTTALRKKKKLGN